MLSLYSNWVYFLVLLYSPQQKVNQNNKYNNNNDYKNDNNLMITRNECKIDSNSCSDNRVNHFVMNSLQNFLYKLQLISDNSTESLILLKASISSRNLNILRQYLPQDYEHLNCEQLEEFEDTINDFIDNIVLINNNNNENHNNYQKMIDLSFNTFKILLYFTTFLITIFIIKPLMRNFLITLKTKTLLTLRNGLILLIIIIILIAIIWKWRQLYLIELSRKQSLVINAPKECLDRCEKMTFISWFRHYLYSYESRRDDYYRAVTVDPFWEINPLTAMSELFSELIFTPLKPLGNFLGLFISKFFSHIPIYLVIPVFIFISFCALLLTVLFAFWLLMPNKYSIQIPFFMTIQFERNNKALTSSKQLIPNSSDGNDKHIVKRYKIRANIVNVYHNNDQLKREEISFDENDYFETNELSIPFSDLD